ncbi:membrane protein insertion efficiency factor YidD [Candidatus Gracilibacteria bacterium]|nr:membrane protein insertion efficiency factor YidD [Candidatus Gracilibacteria bacterium]
MKKLNLLQKILIYLVEFYQRYISPDHSFWAKGMNKTPFCKHTPSCSDYAKEAIEKKGALRGTLKAVWRVLNCMPWNKGGYDPVEKERK